MYMSNTIELKRSDTATVHFAFYMSTCFQDRFFFIKVSNLSEWQNALTLVYLLSSSLFLCAFVCALVLLFTRISSILYLFSSLLICISHSLFSMHSKINARIYKWFWTENWVHTKYTTWIFDNEKTVIQYECHLSFRLCIQYFQTEMLLSSCCLCCISVVNW